MAQTPILWTAGGCFFIFPNIGPVLIIPAQSPGYDSDIPGVERYKRGGGKYFKTLCVKKP